jgi:general secretion pathway protein A
LALWGAEAPEVYTFEELSALAEDNGLRAEALDQATIYNLTVIDRPGIVVLKKSSGLAKSQMLINVDESTVYLLENGEIVLLDKQIFEERWTGTYVYLWQRPKDFLLLQADDVNKPALSWLQAKLGAVSEDSYNIISGGRYTEAVQQQVIEFQRQQNILPDGIVGPQTLMRLNQLTDETIPRLFKADN